MRLYTIPLCNVEEVLETYTTFLIINRYHHNCLQLLMIDLLSTKETSTHRTALPIEVVSRIRNNFRLYSQKQSEEIFLLSSELV